MKIRLAIGIVSVIAVYLVCAFEFQDASVRNVQAAGRKINFPKDFIVTEFTSGGGENIRHIAVSKEGLVYARINNKNGGVKVFQDTNGDGVADKIAEFGKGKGTGIAVYKDHVYYSSDEGIYRQKIIPEALQPEDKIETVINGLPNQGEHGAKPFAMDSQGNIYVTIGAPSNSCQAENRKTGSAGISPCPILENAGGVWKLSAEAVNQNFKQHAKRYATGIRNTVAISWNRNDDSLYLVQHGRDQLSTFFPQYYNDDDNAELPAEEFHKIGEGDNIGWPYTYVAPKTNERVIAPEYGGDGKKKYTENEFKKALIAFPAHWAPNGLVFYDSDAFPGHYRKGAFIAFHGSWNRAPRPQAGYLIAFIPFQNGKYSPDYEIFADNFKGEREIKSPGDAEHRPMGLAVGPKGELYVSDSVQGRIWQIK